MRTEFGCNVGMFEDGGYGIGRQDKDRLSGRMTRTDAHKTAWLFNVVDLSMVVI